MTTHRFPRIAVTMRVVQAKGYSERRDALAQDWGKFLAKALPDAAWLPVPNIGRAALDMVRDFGLDGLILTGGEEHGVSPERDATEAALLDWALEASLPVLGVCRGAQIINLHLGGGVSEAQDSAHAAAHVAVRHDVVLAGSRIQVNSYHRRVIAAADLAPGLAVLARAEDQTIEAFHMPDKPVLGLLWHPEREADPAPHDLDLLRNLFRGP
ncbi:gamma-glutamyl-gamma-aminobutyrate hydrolase family protein [Desulfonatronum parangueonense]